MTKQIIENVNIEFKREFDINASSVELIFTDIKRSYAGVADVKVFKRDVDGNIGHVLNYACILTKTGRVKRNSFSII